MSVNKRLQAAETKMREEINKQEAQWEEVQKITVEELQSKPTLDI
jgi:hypothetical protein